MKRLLVLFWIAIGAFAQSNPGFELLAETERIKALRGTPTVQVVLLTERTGLVAGTFKQTELLDRLERYLKDANIPFQSAKQGASLQNDTLLVDIKLIPLDSSTLAYNINLKLVEIATPLRQPDHQRSVTVWDTHRFGVAINNAGVLNALMDLMTRFATDYLRANPELQPKFGR